VRAGGPKRALPLNSQPAINSRHGTSSGSWGDPSRTRRAELGQQLPAPTGRTDLFQPGGGFHPSSRTAGRAPSAPPAARRPLLAAADPLRSCAGDKRARPTGEARPRASRRQPNADPVSNSCPRSTQEVTLKELKTQDRRASGAWRAVQRLTLPAISAATMGVAQAADQLHQVVLTRAAAAATRAGPLV